MNRTLTLLVSLACVCSPAFLFPTPASGLFPGKELNVSSSSALKLSEWEIKMRAKKITVQVFPENSPQEISSGVLIDKQQQKSGYLYLVLTNDHVLKILKRKATAEAGIGYQVKTYDGEVHKAFLYPKLDWKGNDLGLLYFYSSQEYEEAQKGDSRTLKDGDLVYVSGFPCESSSCQGEFTFTPGKAFTELIRTAKHLDSGYQLGFTNDTKNGMSGGPVLDENGLLVGINGRGKNQDYGLRSGDPSVPDVEPYAYMDGTRPTEDLQQKMKQFAWAIPIQTYIQYVGSNLFERLQSQASGADESETQTSYPPSASSSTEGNHAQASQKGPQNTGQQRSQIAPAIIWIILSLILAVIAGRKWHLSYQLKQPPGQGKKRPPLSSSQSLGAVPSSPSKSTYQPHPTGFLIKIKINQFKRIGYCFVDDIPYPLFCNPSARDYTLKGNPEITLHTLPLKGRIKPEVYCKNSKPQPQINQENEIEVWGFQLLENEWENFPIIVSFTIDSTDQSAS